MDIQIASAKPDDAPKVLDIFTRARVGMTYLPKLHTAEEDKNFIYNLVKSGTVFVAKRGDDILGFTQLKDNWVLQLFVYPTFQNQGIGKLLIDKLKTLSPKELNLWVFEQNSRAIKFYEREGFILVEKRDQAHADNEENLPDRRYRWS